MAERGCDPRIVCHHFFHFNPNLLHNPASHNLGSESSVWPPIKLYQAPIASDVDLGVRYNCSLSSWDKNSISLDIKNSAMAMVLCCCEPSIDCHHFLVSTHIWSIIQSRISDSREPFSPRMWRLRICYKLQVALVLRQDKSSTDRSVSLTSA